MLGTVAHSPHIAQRPAGVLTPSGNLEVCSPADAIGIGSATAGASKGGQLPLGTWALPLLEALLGEDKCLLPLCLPISQQFFLLAEPNGKPASKGTWEM